jgi:phosphoenolpyruvate carboxykinase (ATP)
VPGVDSALLDPRGTWADGEAYDEQATQLADLFRDNFERFESQVSEEVRNAGPHSS